MIWLGSLATGFFFRTRLDLPTAFAKLASSRAAGSPGTPAQYSDLLLACIETNRALVVYRLYEEALQDGVRFDDLSRATKAALRGKLPPDAETVAQAAQGQGTPLPQRLILHDEAPPLWISPQKQAQSFDGRSAEDLARAWEAIERRDAPVHIRNVGHRWPALSEWNLDLLASTLGRGMVRVSPGPAITFCRESHPAVQRGELVPPSRTVAMCADEFVSRLAAGRAGLPPLVYGEGERCYLQALAPHAMMRGVDFGFLPGSVVGGGGGGAAREAAPPVLGRLWVSAPGTYSPLHYDMQDSYLCQVRGCKRMLLWPEGTTLEALRPYPDDHPLARRLKVSVLGDEPDAEMDHNAVDEIRRTAVEAYLRPGDVIYFPSLWGHHTEACLPDGVAPGAEEGASFSLGFRTDGQFLL